MSASTRIMKPDWF